MKQKKSLLTVLLTISVSLLPLIERTNHSITPPESVGSISSHTTSASIDANVAFTKPFGKFYDPTLLFPQSGWGSFSCKSNHNDTPTSFGVPIPCTKANRSTTTNQVLPFYSCFFYNTKLKSKNEVKYGSGSFP